LVGLRSLQHFSATEKVSKKGKLCVVVFGELPHAGRSHGPIDCLQARGRRRRQRDDRPATIRRVDGARSVATVDEPLDGRARCGWAQAALDGELASSEGAAPLKDANHPQVGPVHPERGGSSIIHGSGGGTKGCGSLGRVAETDAGVGLLRHSK